MGGGCPVRFWRELFNGGSKKVLGNSYPSIMQNFLTVIRRAHEPSQHQFCMLWFFWPGFQVVFIIKALLQELLSWRVFDALVGGRHRHKEMTWSSLPDMPHLHSVMMSLTRECATKGLCPHGAAFCFIQGGRNDASAVEQFIKVNVSKKTRNQDARSSSKPGNEAGVKIQININK